MSDEKVYSLSVTETEVLLLHLAVLDYMGTVRIRAEQGDCEVDIEYDNAVERLVKKVGDLFNEIENSGGDEGVKEKEKKSK